MQINHRIAPFLIASDFFKDIDSFEKFIEKTVKIGETQKEKTKENFSVVSEKFYKNNKDKIEKVCQDRYNSMVGDIFEVFSLLYINFYGSKYKVSNVKFSSEYVNKDYGVDAYGVDNIDGDIVGIQCKFRSDKNYELQYKELSTFLSACVTGTGKKELRTKDSNHIMIITTCSGINNHALENFNYDGFVRIISYKDIYNDTMNDKSFWDSLKEITYAKKTNSKNITLYDYQEDIVKLYKNKLMRENSALSTSFILPTAAGKSIIQASLINECINKKGSVIVTVAPSIELVNQLGYTYDSIIKNNIVSYIVSSEGRKNNNGVQEIDNSTNIFDILEKIIESKVSGLPIIISSTYKSFNKIIKALGEIDTPIDLICFDEAHHTTKTEFFTVIEDGIKKGIIKDRLFFTATPSISSTETDVNKCMNNKNIYGEKYIVPMKSLVDKGYLCKALLSIVNGTGYIDKNKKDIIKSIINQREKQINDILQTKEIISYDVGEILSVLFAIECTVNQCRLYKNKNIDVKIIISCASVSKAHLLSFILNDIFKIIDNAIFKEEWFIDAISSDQELTRNYSVNKSREKSLLEFKKNGNGIMCHYDVLSEGVDIPTCSRVIPLRGMCERVIVQTLGRTLRRVPDDIAQLKNNYGTENFKKLLEDNNQWDKPYGGMIVPIYGDSENIKNIIEDIFNKLLMAGIDYIPNEIEYHTCGEKDNETKALRNMATEIRSSYIDNIETFSINPKFGCNTKYYDVQKEDIVCELLKSYLKKDN